MTYFSAFQRTSNQPNAFHSGRSNTKLKKAKEERSKNVIKRNNLEAKSKSSYIVKESFTSTLSNLSKRWKIKTLDQ